MGVTASRKRARFLPWMWLAFLALLFLVQSSSGYPATPHRPNFIFILIDDLRWDEMDYPFVRFPAMEQIAREGVRFRNAFVTTPLCSPSRASFLTGQYPHHHGITDNTDRSPRSHQMVTFLRLLHDAGYETAFVGKWHMGVDDTARPGIDHWVSIKGQGRYIDPEFNVNGQRSVFPGYFTDHLNKFAMDFLRQKHSKPFVLYVSHKSVHPDLTQYADGSVSDPNADKFIPADRHKELFSKGQIPHSPSYGKPPEDKPALQRQLPGVPPLGLATVTKDEDIRNRLRMLASADEGVGQMLAALKEQGQLENTVVVFTSDEGYFYGEHGLSTERRLAYEESARIPLYMRVPKSAGITRGPAGKPGSQINEFALSIDVAPTLLDFAGAPPAPGMDGRSLLPLLRGDKVKWRDSFLIEYFSDTVMPRVSKMGYQSVRTPRWSYIHYVDLQGMDELYDIQADPYQLKNLIGLAQSQATIQSLQGELGRLVKLKKN